MRYGNLLDRVNLVHLIAVHCGPDAVRGLHPERGGLIRDPRPGHEERTPSLSVYRNRNRRWRYNRFGDDHANGDAFDLLLALGFSRAEAWAELARFVGVTLDGWDPGRRAQALEARNYLQEARWTLDKYRPLSDNERRRLSHLIAPLKSQDAAGGELTERGLFGWAGLEVGKLRQDFTTREGKKLARVGSLALLIRGPDGQPVGLKVRNLGTKAALEAVGLQRYVYRIAGHGSPAWCSPNYGAGKAVLIVEGELNGAAAAHALSFAEVPVDVQGLAGANGTPFLDGLKNRLVYIYADPDEPGAACAERVAQIACAAGACEVRILTSLPEGDFCDLAGRLDIHTFEAWLLDRIARANRWQVVITSKIKLPVDNAAQHGGSVYWQTGNTQQDWGGTDASGWGSSERGGW